LEHAGVLIRSSDLSRRYLRGLAKITEKNRELVARNNETAIKLFEKNDQLNQESTAAARFKQNIGAVLEVSV
jgi:hypothetical protein